MMFIRVTSFNEGCELHIIDKTLTAEQIEYLKELGETHGEMTSETAAIRT
ncbi:hypothetical protein [Burkholderia sp. NRF60-BP8]|nr:hypothetical protein [Burkholderia sp. NRF60-BP8]